MAKQQTQVKLRFLHPRDSREFEAEVGAATTGQAALDGLIKAGFVEAPNGSRAFALQLQRTGKTIPLSASLVTQGAVEGDVVAVTETSAGATE